MMEEDCVGLSGAALRQADGPVTCWNRCNFKDARLFYPAFNWKNQVRTYAVYGGMPGLFEYNPPSNSLDEIFDVFSAGYTV